MTHVDDAGHFAHPCCVCGKEGSFGHGVLLRKGKFGTWYCREHEPNVPTQTLPPPVAPALLPVMTLVQVQAELRSGKGDAARRRALWLLLDKLIAAKG